MDREGAALRTKDRRGQELSAVYVPPGSTTVWLFAETTLFWPADPRLNVVPAHATALPPRASMNNCNPGRRDSPGSYGRHQSSRPD